MKKILASVALAGLLTLGAGTMAAQAAPDYPAAPPAATVSTGTVTPGGSVTFAGTGFTPGEIIDVTVVQSSPVAGGAIGGLGGGLGASVPMIIKPAAPTAFTTTAAADGSFSVPVTLEQTGTYTLTATGRTSGVSVSQVVKVAASTDGTVGNETGAGAGTGTNVAAGENAGGLASTGIDAGVLVWSIVGAGALAAGVGTVVVSRRRSRSTENA